MLLWFYFRGAWIVFGTLAQILPLEVQGACSSHFWGVEGWTDSRLGKRKAAGFVATSVTENKECFGF